MNKENIRIIHVGDYVEGREVKTDRFVRGTLMGYTLQDHTDPDSVVAVIAKDHSHTDIHITKASMSLVSRYETLLKALHNSGLDYVNGKIVGRHVPKFCAGDIVRHKNYGDQTRWNCRITYVSENGYSYLYTDNAGGGTFNFSGECDYNLIKEE